GVTHSTYQHPGTDRHLRRGVGQGGDIDGRSALLDAGEHTPVPVGCGTTDQLLTAVDRIPTPLQNLFESRRSGTSRRDESEDQYQGREFLHSCGPAPQTGRCLTGPAGSTVIRADHLLVTSSMLSD